MQPSEIRRLGFEDTLHAILDVLQEIASSRSSGSSSLDIEDMAKGPPKVTSHGSVGVPMPEEYIRARIAEHALAHRLAQEAFERQWAETVALADNGLSLEEMKAIALERGKARMDKIDFNVGKLERS